MFHSHSFLGHTRHRGPFRRGVIKYIILDFLKDKPSHGYEIIRSLEERSHGMYVPSAGTIYPTLQMLEEMGYVSAAEQEGKKVYTITDEGRRFLAEQGGLGDKIRERLSGGNPQNPDEVRETMREFGRLAEMLGWETRKMDTEKLARVREVLAHAYEDIEGIAKG
ncbi:MAG: PadR family transcriptional regulator [Chloroflexota bacterium]